MFRCQRLRCLDLNNYLVEADKIGAIDLLQPFAFVYKWQIFLRGKWNFAPAKLQRETFLINRLKKTAAHLTIDIEDGPPWIA